MSSKTINNTSVYPITTDAKDTSARNVNRTISLAQAAQALANQTGGNIMGFTYE